MSNFPLHSGSWSGLKLHKFHNAVETIVSSYVRLPCFIQKVMFHCCSSTTALSSTVSSPFSTMISVSGRVQNVHVPFMAEHSAVSYDLHCGQL